MAEIVKTEPPVLLGVRFYFVNIFLSPVEKLRAVEIPSITWVIELITSHWFMLHLFHFKAERVSRLPPPLQHTRTHVHLPSSRPCDSPQSTETGNGAERRDSSARDWNQNPPTRHPTLTHTNPPLHSLTHTHKHICTDVPNPPGSPICFLTCHSQRCFSAKLETPYFPAFPSCWEVVWNGFKCFRFHVGYYSLIKVYFTKVFDLKMESQAPAVRVVTSFECRNNKRLSIKEQRVKCAQTLNVKFN